MKECRKCKVIKSIDEFHIDRKSKDGHHSYCKDCNRKRTRGYFSTPDGRIKKKIFDKAYAASEQGRQAHIKARRKYNRSPKGQVKNRQYEQNYAKTEKGKIVHKEAISRYKSQNVEKVKAQNAVSRAVKRGIIPNINTQICANCKKQAKHYHHWSYKPEHRLDVIPLCVDCHNKRHWKI